jgi:ubiquitin-activating enzyme E1 C
MVRRADVSPLTPQYVGNDSVYAYTFEYDKREDCPVCGGESITAEIGNDWTLERLVEWLSERQNMSAVLHASHSRRADTPRQISKPSLSHPSGKPLYFQAPPQLHDATKPNLDRLVSDLLADEGPDLVVTDPNLPFSLGVTIAFV